MKKILVLILTLFLINCSSYKARVSETQQWINAQDFIIDKPNHWRPVMHHGYVGFTPIKKVGNHFNTMVSLFKYNLEGKTNFKEFVEKEIQQTNTFSDIITQDISIYEGQYGDVYIHEFESSWSFYYYKTQTIYFERNDQYYCYEYSSLKKNYDKYFKEASSILDSVIFKH